LPHSLTTWFRHYFPPLLPPLTDFPPSSPTVQPYPVFIYMAILPLL
jgi:hypothetical protein